MFRNLKVFGLLLLLVCISAALVFAGGKQESGDGSQSTAAKQHTINFWMHDSPQTTTYLKEILPDYEKENPGIKVEAQYIPFSDYETKLMVSLTGGQGPDCFDIGDWNIMAYYDKGLLSPINYKAFGYNSLSALKDAWWPSSLGGFEMENNVYGIPMEYNTFSLFVNKKYFEEAGLDAKNDAPKTWTEMAEIGKKIVKKDASGRYIREAFDWPHLGAVWTVLTFEPLVNQLGGSLLAAGGGPNFDSPEVIKALETYKGLLWEHGLGDGAVGTSSSTLPNADFNSGEVAMWITGPWAQPLLTEMQGKYEIVPLPQTKGGMESTILYSWAWVVNAKAAGKNQEEAWKFLNFLSNHQVGFLTNAGYLQPRIGWEDSKEFKEFPFIDVFYNDMAKGKFMFRSTKWAEYGEIINRAVERAVLSNEDPAKVLKEAQKEALNIK